MFNVASKNLPFLSIIAVAFAKFYAIIENRNHLLYGRNKMNDYHELLQEENMELLRANPLLKGLTDDEIAAFLH